MFFIKLCAILTVIASSLIYHAEPDPGEGPFILDGPGMVYIDSEYRTEYANCLPYEDINGGPYLAISYLGHGENGRKNKDICIERIFESLNKNSIRNIKTYEFGGDYWYLVIPKYHDHVGLISNGEFLQVASQGGEPFVIRCNNDITLNIFNVSDMYYTPSITENGTLQGTEEDFKEIVWDITNLI